MARTCGLRRLPAAKVSGQVAKLDLVETAQATNKPISTCETTLPSMLTKLTKQSRRRAYAGAYAACFPEKCLRRLTPCRVLLTRGLVMTQLLLGM